MVNTVDTITDQVHCHTETLKGYKHSVQLIDDLYDCIRAEQSGTDMQLRAMHDQMKKIHIEYEKILDIQCRSMQDNLIFNGIAEHDLQPGEYKKRMVFTHS